MPVPDETTLCPRFRLSQSPTPGVLPHRECVFKNEFANKPTNPTLQKNKTLNFFFFFLCQKLWTCWLSILRTKLLLNFNLLFFFFLLNNPDEKLWGLGWPGPKDLKGHLLAAPGWLWEGPCHHLLIIPWGMSALANPTWRGQGWGQSTLHCPPAHPSSVCLNCGSCRRTCSHSYLTIS